MLIQFQMDLYDQFLYTPLQTSLLPVVCKIPRTVVFSNKSYTVFTANIVSYSRTILVIPIAICLKYEHSCFLFKSTWHFCSFFPSWYILFKIWYANTQGTSSIRQRFYWSSCMTSWITWMESWLKLTGRCLVRLTIHCWADSWTHSVTRFTISTLYHMLSILQRLKFYSILFCNSVLSTIYIF